MLAPTDDVSNLIGNTRQFGVCTGILSCGDTIGEPHEDGPPYRATAVATTMVEMVKIQEQDRGLFHAAGHELVLAPGLSRLLLLTPTHNRDAYTVEHLARLARSVEVFKQFAPGVIRNLCQVMTLSQYSPGEIIFKQGSVGTAFYVILTGSVRVVVRSPEKDAATSWAGKKSAAGPRLRGFVRAPADAGGASPRTLHGTVVGTMCTLN